MYESCSIGTSLRRLGYRLVEYLYHAPMQRPRPRPTATPAQVPGWALRCCVVRGETRSCRCARCWAQPNARAMALATTADATRPSSVVGSWPASSELAPSATDGSGATGGRTISGCGVDCGREAFVLGGSRRAPLNARRLRDWSRVRIVETRRRKGPRAAWASAARVARNCAGHVAGIA